MCVALLAYCAQSFASAGGLVMSRTMISMPVAVDETEFAMSDSSMSDAMPDCHMKKMALNNDMGLNNDSVIEPGDTPNCCVSGQCENGCSMAHCNPAIALICTVSLPWFVVVKPSPYTFHTTSFVYYPRSFSRPPIFS